MELETVDGETWVRLEGLMFTEHGALSRCFEITRAASAAETQAGALLMGANITNPERPEYDPDNPMPTRRPWGCS